MDLSLGQLTIQNLSTLRIEKSMRNLTSYLFLTREKSCAKFHGSGEEMTNGLMGRSAKSLCTFDTTSPDF
jgi:hypothetical protein